MLFDRKAVQENIRNREGKRVFYLGKGYQLTSDARDWLTRERIPILPAEQARPEEYRLLSGAYMKEKPEHMTHLQGDILVSKAHPRIAFRGCMDSLQARLLWCQLEIPALEQPLGELLQYSQRLLSWEVLEEPVKEDQLLGLTPEQLRLQSHRPQDYFKVPHFMPALSDGRNILALNLARAEARKAELAAVRAFTDPEGRPERTDLLQALNRLSSAIYILMLKEKAKQ